MVLDRLFILEIRGLAFLFRPTSVTSDVHCYVFKSVIWHKIHAVDQEKRANLSSQFEWVMVISSNHLRIAKQGFQSIDLLISGSCLQRDLHIMNPGFQSQKLLHLQLGS